MNRLHSFAVALLLALPVAATASMAQADLRGPVGLVDYEVLRKNVYPIVGATTTAASGAVGQPFFTAHKAHFQLAADGGLQGLVLYYDRDGDDRFDAGEEELLVDGSGADPRQVVLPDGTTAPPATDANDGYAVIIEADSVASATPRGGFYEYKVHVRDYRAGGAKVNPIGSALRFELYDYQLLVNLAKSQGQVAMPQYRTSFVVQAADLDGAGNVMVRVPTSKTPLGPMVPCTYVNVADRPDGVDSARGCHSLAKNRLQERQEADALDFALTPVLQLWDMGCDLTAGDCDGDQFGTADELSRGSDPTDRASTPLSDDDCDGVLNKDEIDRGQPPSWLAATQERPCGGEGL